MTLVDRYLTGIVRISSAAHEHVNADCSGTGSRLLPVLSIVTYKNLSRSYLYLSPDTIPQQTMATISTPITQLFGIKHPILLAGYAFPIVHIPFPNTFVVS